VNGRENLKYGNENHDNSDKRGGQRKINNTIVQCTRAIIVGSSAMFKSKPTFHLIYSLP
jgi:hypothetical protein